jgi:hypothetical protein
MILRPLSGTNVSEFTIKLVVIIIRNNNRHITKKHLRDTFRQTIYFHGCRELRSYYNTCLMLMTFNLHEDTILSLDENNNIIAI